MIDPFSLTGMAIIGSRLTRHNTCPVCKQVRLFSTWQSWTCCDVSQCPDCAAQTQRTKSCRNCGHKVK
jgi:hypothetical protein